MTDLMKTVTLDELVSVKYGAHKHHDVIVAAIRRNVIQVAMRSFENFLSGEQEEFDVRDCAVIGAVIMERWDVALWLLRHEVVQSYSPYWDIPALKRIYPCEGMQQDVALYPSGHRFLVMLDKSITIDSSFDTQVLVGTASSYNPRQTEAQYEMYRSVGAEYVRQVKARESELDFSYTEEVVKDVE